MSTLYGREALDELEMNNIPLDDIEDGCQLKANHTTCHMGQDTKSRLYIKNVDGAYLWHCHNCATSGYYRPKETTSRMRPSSATVTSSNVVDLHKWHVAEQDYDNFKVEGQLWLAQYGFSEKECTHFNIRETKHGILLPIYSDVRMCGYQMRNYNSTPKYVTYTNQRMSYIRGVKETLVLTEDLLSSYKLNKVGYSTLCLLGTKLGADTLDFVTMLKPSKLVIWLDDDTAGHTGCMKLFKELSAVCRNIISINNEQPKEISIETLSEMEL